MKHAGPETLKQLAPLLDRLRSIPGLVERKPGTFYVRSTAFLHFHEDPAGLFADVKLDGDSFQRLPLHTAAHQSSLLQTVAQAVARVHKPKSAGAASR